jgi:hypothetical protein
LRIILSASSLRLVVGLAEVALNKSHSPCQVLVLEVPISS